MGGRRLLKYTEIAAFQQLTGVTFTPWEVEQIEMLDRVFIRISSERSEVNKAQTDG